MDQNVSASLISKPSLQLPPDPKAPSELPAPLVFVFLFHLMAGDVVFQEGVHTAESYLAAVQGHAHPIAGKGRDHTRSIPYEKDMVFHPGPTFKTYLRN